MLNRLGPENWSSLLTRGATIGRNAAGSASQKHTENAFLTYREGVNAGSGNQRTFGLFFTALEDRVRMERILGITLRKVNSEASPSDSTSADLLTLLNGGVKASEPSNQLLNALSGTSSHSHDQQSVISTHHVSSAIPSPSSDSQSLLSLLNGASVITQLPVTTPSDELLNILNAPADKYTDSNSSSLLHLLNQDSQHSEAATGSSFLLQTLNKTAIARTNGRMTNGQIDLLETLNKSTRSEKSSKQLNKNIMQNKATKADAGSQHDTRMLSKKEFIQAYMERIQNEPLLQEQLYSAYKMSFNRE